MSTSSTEITKGHLHHLLRRVLPLEASESYVNNVLEDIHGSVLSNINGTNVNSVRLILDRYQQVILFSDSDGSKWKIFRDMIENLFNFKTMDQVTNYLVFLDSLHQSDHETSQTRYSSMTHVQNPFVEQEKNFRSSSFTIGGKTLNQMIQPYYYEHKGTLRDEEILKYLSYTLLGSTSTLFPFSDNGLIQLPTNINYSIGGVLSTLLEPALIYKYLISKYSISRQQGTLSQIKLAFVTELTNTYLGGYLKLVNFIFSQQDLTLKKLHLAIFDEIIKLRFLLYLTSLLENPGAEFVSHLFNFSHHGDELIRQMAQNLFIKSAIPYYDLVLEWITNGEIGNDAENEFFVQCNKTAFDKSLNDYEFVAEKVPAFFPTKIVEKIYQIGKTIVFLKNYCKELKWLNELNSKYKEIIIVRHDGLINMNINKFSVLIETEYNEVINYASSIIYNNFKLLDDIKGINNVLMRKGDLINSILRKGAEILDEPSSSLTSHKLNRLLIDAIEDSSFKNYPLETLNRIDARMLNHGSVGYESFTLDYHSLLPLIFDDSIKEYLRLFNFFFKLKRASYKLNEAWLSGSSFKNLNRYVKRLKLLAKREGNSLSSTFDADYIYAMNHIKKLNIVSCNMTKFVNEVSMFFNYEIVEKNFNKLIDLFESKDNKTRVQIDQYGKKTMPRLIPRKQYLSSVNGMVGSIPEPELIVNIYNDFNIDEMIKYHQEYIRSISRNKLLDTKAVSSKGRYSGTYFIHQLNNLISIVHKFLIINEEFSNNILDLITALDTVGKDNNYIEPLKKRMELLNDNLYDVLYKFKGCSDVFNHDLINDDDPQLKYFGTILCG